jgi:hypothetical protein
LIVSRVPLLLILDVSGFRGWRGAPLFVLVFVGADGEKGVREHGEGHVPVSIQVRS